MPSKRVQAKLVELTIAGRGYAICPACGTPLTFDSYQYWQRQTKQSAKRQGIHALVEIKQLSRPLARSTVGFYVFYCRTKKQIINGSTTHGRGVWGKTVRMPGSRQGGLESELFEGTFYMFTPEELKLVNQ